MRSSNITRDMDFIYADSDVTFRELLGIHELNKIESDAINENMKQIRNGAKW